MPCSWNLQNVMKKILCIHGIGGQDAKMNQWIPDWKKSFYHLFRMGCTLNFCFMKMDDLFSESRNRMGGIRYLKAIAIFVDSWVHAIQKETFSETDYSEVIRWTAGMPAQFITDAILREKLRGRLASILCAYRPDLVYAHSLGTLVLYDLLRKKTQRLPNNPFTILTSGSQLNHPAIARLFGGLHPVQTSWVNLHNKNDKVFASRAIDLWAPGFLEVETPFEKGVLNHSASSYLGHVNTAGIAWQMTAQAGLSGRSIDGETLGSSSPLLY